MNTKTVFVDIRDPVEKRDRPYPKECVICSLRDIGIMLHPISKNSKIVIVFSQDKKQAEAAKSVAIGMGFTNVKLHDVDDQHKKVQVDYKRSKKRSKPRTTNATITVKKRKQLVNET